MREIDRAIDQLGATGVQVFTNVNGEPLDKPEYLQLFERMAEPSTCRSGCTRRAPPTFPTTSARSARSTTCGGRSAGRTRPRWPWRDCCSRACSTAIPNLKIITHHLGGMVPHFEGRVGGGLDQLGKRTDDPDDASARGRLQQRPIDYFRMFYGDTALFGPAHAVECGLEFFGADHVLFGTDMPFDPEGGPGIRARHDQGRQRHSRLGCRSRSRSMRATRGACCGSSCPERFGVPWRPGAGLAERRTVPAVGDLPRSGPWPS